MHRIFDYMFQAASLRVFILLFLSIVGNKTYSQQFHFKQFGLTEGVPQSQVFDMLNDSRGFLWIGTRGGGLARFDGNSFKNYQTGNGLINNFVNCLVEDSKNNLWVGTQAGISMYNGREFTNFPISGKGEIRVFTIAEVDNRMLFGTSQGLYELTQGKIRPVDLMHSGSSFYVNALWITKKHVYVGTNRGFYKLDRKDLTIDRVYTEINGLPDNYIQCIKGVTDTSCWIGTYGRGLRFFHGNTIEKVNFSVPENLIVYDLEIDDKNQLWVATQKHGAYRIDLDLKQVWEYTEKTGLSNNHVRCLTTDQWGGVWLGTSGGGINQYTGQLFSHYTKKDGLSDNYVYAIAQDLDGSIWIGNGNKGITHLDTLGPAYLRDSVWANLKVKAMAQAPDSTWWFGTEGQGLYTFKNGEITHLNSKNGLCGNYIKDIEISPDGTVFIATLDGGMSEIKVVDGERIIKNYRYLTELLTNRILSLLIDIQGSCWFGTESKGIGRIFNGKADTIISDQSINYQAIRAMRMDDNNRLWLASSSGLYCYNVADKKLTLKGQTELRSANLYLLEFDLTGRLYVGHERGLDVLTLNESGEVIDVEYYGADEGFLGIETCQNAAIRGRDGFLWFGTISGLTRYNPNRSESPSRPPTVWLESIDLFYEKLNPNTYKYQPTNWDAVEGIPEFPYNKNHFGFELIGIQLAHPGKVRYQWKLMGYDDDWTPITTKKDATYSNLPPGSYTFLYRAVTDDGIVGQEKQWSFVILAPFWQTWWFRLLIAALLVILVFLSFQYYLRGIKKQQQQLRIEKEMIELEQKALRLQMNPHFLFNALNSIQSLVALDNTKEARNYLQKFAKLMRLTLQNSRVERIKLSDEINTLENYLSLEQLTRQPSFSFTFSIAPELDPDEISIPPMMLQPFVENAIKHGIGHMGDKGMIKLDFTLDQDLLVCTISDNGIGVEAAKEKSKNKAKSHESAAIQVITDRLAILNREHMGHSILIEDIIENKNVVGTKVVVTLHAW